MSAAPPTRHRRLVAESVGARLQRWEDRTAWPMFVFSVAFFVASVWLIGADRPSRATVTLLASVVAVTWVIFIVDFVIRLVIAVHRPAFLVQRWFEVVSLVVPILRPFLIVAYIWRLPVFRRSPTHVRMRFVVTMATFALLFVYVASTLVWIIERKDPRANILNLEDAIWWGFTTITTVGYGDYTPVTTGGRLVAILLMVGGIFVVGVASATVVTFLADQVRRVSGNVAGGRGAPDGSAEAVPARPSGLPSAADTASGSPSGSMPSSGSGPSAGSGPSGSAPSGSAPSGSAPSGSEPSLRTGP